MGALRILGVGAAALALYGCEAAHGGVAGGANSVCAPFATAATTTPAAANAPATAAPLANADPASATDDCLHRWAYALAGSIDDAGHVAQAALAACEPTLARWNQQTAPGDGGGPVEAPSLITGRPTSPIEQHLAFAQSRAEFYVVQARAGHCAAPPMKDGVPAGLTRD
jgi:hypothetical protein